MPYHRVTAKFKPNLIEYSKLIASNFFQFSSTDNDIYLKLGMRAVNLKTSEQISMRQDQFIIPIQPGTEITIIVGSK